MMDRKEGFLMLPYKLLNASGYVSTSGEKVKMNLSDKVVYCYLKNRFDFFQKSGKEYFDTQQSIANVCCMDVKGVGNILRKFIKNGLTPVYKKPYGNFSKNIYKDVPNLVLWYKDDKELDSLSEFDYSMPEDFIPNLPDIGYQGERDDI